jgi:hypothetical protein
MQAYAKLALVSGVTGGVMAELQGGRFGNGFVSAGVNALLAPIPEAASSKPGLQAVYAAVVGGTVSRISGGKFANGAVTGAFQFALGRAITSKQSARLNDSKLEAALDAYAARDGSDSYAIAYESSPYLRATVPGQVAWDNAVTSWEAGNYGYAALHATAMLGEQVLYASTLGQGGAILPATRAATSNAINVSFGHGARHLVGTNLTQDAVEFAVRSEVQKIGQAAGNYWGRVGVQGTLIEYRAYPLANGTTNVGTYYPIFPGH